MASTPTRLMTFGEFERLPNPKSGRLELRHGELFTGAPPIHKHYLARRRLRRLLEHAAGEAGIVDTEMAYRAQDGYEYRIADIAFVRIERWKRIFEESNLRGAPDLVIEILSPSNTVAEIFDKRALCLENGATEFWVVDTGHRQVEVSTADGRAVTYRSGQQIPLFLASGAHLDVASLFSDPA